VKSKEPLKAAKNSLRAASALTPAVVYILIALADRDRHGYAIMQEVNARSAGSVRLGPGTLYGAISRMLKEGLIEESDERPDPELDDTRRRYYRLTDRGRRALAAEVKRLGDLVRLARSIGAVREFDQA
jgi:DNA-binding PadR family transcriptional regulator